MAHCNVRRAATGKFQWEATEPKPVFELVTKNGALPDGWVEISFGLQGPEGLALTPCIYVQHRSSEVFGSPVRLPDPQNGWIHTVVRLPKPVHGLRLVPLTQESSFSLGPLRIRKITSLEAGLRLGWPYAKPLLRRPSQLSRALRELGAIWRDEGTLGLKKRLAGELTMPPASSYRAWIERYDTLTDWDRGRIRARLEKLANRPTISILLPIQTESPELLRRSIRSIQSQLYPDWQICIAGTPSSGEQHSLVVVEELAGNARIQMSISEENALPAQALNSALKLSTGGWVTVLSPGDLLREHSLYMLAEAIGSHADARIIYSDHDEITENGDRFNHDFKPDWNAELFYSHNYLSRLTAIDAELVKKAGEFRANQEGLEEYDLLLRCIRACSPKEIRHLPHVLYHSRAINRGERSSRALVNLLKDHWQPSSSGVQVGPGLIPGTCHISYPVPSPAPLVSIIVPTKDQRKLLKSALESIFGKTKYSPFELIVVDNQSRDPDLVAYLGTLEKSNRARVLKYDRPFNYSTINNLAAKEARGELFAFLNNDLEVISSNWLSEMVSLALGVDVGAVGALLYYPNNRVQHAGIVLGLHRMVDHLYRGLPREDGGYHGRTKLVQDVSAVTGACLVTRRSVFERAGGFDETLPVAFNDIDFCLRLRKLGLRNVFTPYAELYHQESMTRGPDDSLEKQERLHNDIEIMLERWDGWLAEDPYFNPNLSLDHVYPTLARPPRRPWPWKAGKFE